MSETKGETPKKESVTERYAKSGNNTFNDGKLHAVVVGSGGPIATAKRQEYCIALIAGEKVFVFDAGHGAGRSAVLQGIPIGQTQAVFITHFHSDHVGGLGSLYYTTWVTGSRKHPFEVYGPKGVEKVVDGFRLVYEQDFKYRFAHHGPDVLAKEGMEINAHPFDVPDPGVLAEVFDDGEFKISTFRVDHSPVDPAVGYRIEYQNKTVVLTGDTMYKDYLKDACQDADVLFAGGVSHKLIGNLGAAAQRAGNARAKKIMDDVVEYHMDPPVAAKLAQESGVSHLVLLHVVPPLQTFEMEEAYMQGVEEAFDGKVDLATDGLTFVVE